MYRSICVYYIHILAIIIVNYNNVHLLYVFSKYSAHTIQCTVYSTRDISIMIDTLSHVLYQVCICV